MYLVGSCKIKSGSLFLFSFSLNRGFLLSLVLLTLISAFVAPLLVRVNSDVTRVSLPVADRTWRTCTDPTDGSNVSLMRSTGRQFKRWSLDQVTSLDYILHAGIPPVLLVTECGTRTILCTKRPLRVVLDLHSAMLSLRTVVLELLLWC